MFIQRGAGGAALQAGVVEAEGEHPAIRIKAGLEAGNGGGRREEPLKQLLAVPVGDEGEGQAVGIDAGVVHLLKPAAFSIGAAVLPPAHVEGLRRVQPGFHSIQGGLNGVLRHPAVGVHQHPHGTRLGQPFPGGGGADTAGGKAHLAWAGDLIGSIGVQTRQVHPAAGFSEHPVQKAGFTAAVGVFHHKVV